MVPVADRICQEALDWPLTATKEAMRRADRLFEIIQVLRRKKLVRARDLAEHLEVSERTVYRDISDLMASGVPIEGEAGVGYVLRGGYDLPPIMFDEQEIEALVLGARIVESWADPALAKAAGRVIAKVETVIPEGNDPHPAKMFDLIMLAIPGGRERTAKEYRSLFEAAGLSLTRIVPTASPVSVIEAAAR